MLKTTIFLICLLHQFSFSGYCYTFYLQQREDTISSISGQDPKEVQASADHKGFFKRVENSKYLLPVLFVGYGFTSLNNGITRQTDKYIRNELSEEYPRFSTHLDDKLQYAPVAAVYALNLIGLKGKSNLLDRTAIYFISNSIMNFSVDYLKTKTQKLRPSGSDTRSFPSGHTANAFAGAEFMRQEFSEKSPWIGYIGYSMATATGGLRMMNNQHWLSDVIAGAGIGIISTKLTYLAYPWIKKTILKNKQMKMIAVPLIQDQKFGFSLMAPL